MSDEKKVTEASKVSAKPAPKGKSTAKAKDPVKSPVADISKVDETAKASTNNDPKTAIPTLPDGSANWEELTFLSTKDDTVYGAQLRKGVLVKMDGSLAFIAGGKILDRGNGVEVV